MHWRSNVWEVGIDIKTDDLYRHIVDCLRRLPSRLSVREPLTWQRSI